MAQARPDSGRKNIVGWLLMPDFRPKCRSQMSQSPIAAVQEIHSANPHLPYAGSSIMPDSILEHCTPPPALTLIQEPSRQRAQYSPGYRSPHDQKTL